MQLLNSNLTYHRKSYYLLLLLFITFSSVQDAIGQVNCGDPGTIRNGSSAILDPNSDGFFSNTGTSWTLINEEYSEFETLIPGSGGSNLNWTPLGGTEPTGVNASDDVGSGGNCGNTDITTDANGGTDYAYYSIVDPDQIANNGDEYIAFAMRIADRINGAFTFSFLLDTDNNCGSDPNSVCGNPCFEYEVQLNTQNEEVILIAIDGCTGTSDCDALNGPSTPNGTDAYVCNPCNTEALQVCAGSSECGTSNPVFWIWYIPFSDIDGLNSSDPFSLAPVTTTSPNSVIYKNTNVSDYGGIGDPNDPSECDCATICAASACSDCIQDCALSCSAIENNFNTFPVEFQAFKGKWDQGSIVLNWETASELNNDHFVVERTIDGQNFDPLSIIDGAGTSDRVNSYLFVDQSPMKGINYYRIKQVDYDGKFSYSQLLSIHNKEVESHFYVTNNNASDKLELNLFNLADQPLRVDLMDMQGRTHHTLEIKAQEGNHVLAIPTQNLSSGIYFLRLSNDSFETIQHKKILIKS